MANLKAALRWVTFLPAALVAGQLVCILLPIVAKWSMVSGGGIEPDSPEYAVMAWVYQLFGDVALGGVAVWVAWVWVPSRKLGAALSFCLLLCAVSGALVYLTLIGRASSQAFDMLRLIAEAIGALLAMGYLVGEHQGDKDWFDKAITGGWHGLGGPAHLSLSALAAIPLWWQAADPVGGWRESTSGTSLWEWAAGVVGWLWHLAVMAPLCFIVSGVALSLLVLAVKLPLILMWRLHLRTREAPSPAGSDVDEYGETALHRAARRGDAAEVDRLLAGGVDVNVAGAMDGCTPLHLVTEHEGVAAVLIRKGADVTARAVFGDTPLHFAAFHNSVGVARLLVDSGAQVDATDRWGQTPLHSAARGGGTDVARFLLEHGANPNAKDREGRTPMTNVEGSGELTSLLLSYGADRLEEVTGADVNAPLADGKSWLHLAAADGNVAWVELLLEKGARLEAQDANGMTPLHLAALLGQDEVVALLVGKGAGVNTREGDRTTPLHAAAMRANPSTVRLLIAHGADVNARSETGQTPLHWAVSLGHAPSVLLLLQGGADACSRDRDGVTPLSTAIDEGDEAVLDVFRGHGAI